MRRQWYVGFGISLLVLLSFFIMLNDLIWFFIFLTPLLILWTYDLVQTKHSLLRNFPVLGHIRYLFEFLRPEIQQYFIATDQSEVKRLDQIYEYLEPGQLLGSTIPLLYKADWDKADASSF